MLVYDICSFLKGDVKRFLKIRLVLNDITFFDGFVLTCSGARIKFMLS